MSKVISIKLREEEMDKVVGQWLKYILNTGEDLTRHGFLKRLLLGEENVRRFFDAEKEQGVNFS